MKMFFAPAIILLAGAASLIIPLKVIAECGLNPVTHMPSKCNPPSETGPTGLVGFCAGENDGTCTNLSCAGTAWGNALPGRCVNGIITENNVPVCESDFAATVVTVHQYTQACESVGGCECVWTQTGEKQNVQVCNCRDLAPLN